MAISLRPRPFSTRNGVPRAFSAVADDMVWIPPRLNTLTTCDRLLARSCSGRLLNQGGVLLCDRMDESKLCLHMLKVFGHKRICDISRRDVDM